MKVTKNIKNELVITFEYSAPLVEIVKHFDSRKYNAKTKEWKVPLIHIIKVVDTLINFGFKISDEVIEIYKEKVRHKEKIKKIKSGNFNEKQKEVFKKIGLPLFEYQKIGTGFLVATKSSLLGDEPGLGKTIQSISASLIRGAEKVLIICPSALKYNWCDEIDKWAKGKKSIVIGGTKEKRNEQWQKKSDFYIMNYELLLRDMTSINKIKWDFIIADEATRISNPKAKQSKLIKKIKTKHRIALTGTPLNNNVHDIWNILDFCQPGLLGTFWQFTQKYCDKDKFGSIIGYKNLNELKGHISDNMIRRKKKEVLKELPDKLYETLYIELDPEEKKIYEAIKNEITIELKEYQVNKVLKDRYLSNALVKMVRLKQATGSLELVSDHKFSSKLNVLKELFEDILHEENKAIVFTQFKEMAYILHKELKEYNPLLFTGDTLNEERAKIVKQFNEDSIHRIIIFTESGTYGLNLQRANYIIHYDLPWSISKLEQREGRAHRIGQSKNVTVFRLIAQNTIDEYIVKILYKKEKLSESILSDKERARKVKLTKKDIKQILSTDKL